MGPTGPRVDPVTGAAVAVAVAAVATSGPLIAYAAAPALAIAFWRNALAGALLAPVAAVRRRAELRRLAAPAGRREGLVCVLAGVALAVHFATWVPSVKLTTVAAATALGATQPVWQGLIARYQGRRLSGGTWLGIGCAVLGAALATGADVAVSPAAVAGDLLAVGGGLAAAVYHALGERARVTVSTTAYTTVAYGVCALVLLTVCLAAGLPLAGYSGDTWLAILGLVVGAQLLGHSLFNYALHRISATTVSVLILLEVPGAALLAWAWLGQVPRPVSLAGLGLLLVGVALVVRRPQRGAGAPALPVVPPEPPEPAGPGVPTGPRGRPR
ncbi:MAG TPA: DMT family transporter [Pilimelia sp.]|nr:DMT family transporter [Pilimelia sp.]